MIFVLDDDVYADTRLKQRPSILRGRRHAGVHKRNDALKLSEAKQGIAQRNCQAIRRGECCRSVPDCGRIETGTD